MTQTARTTFWLRTILVVGLVIGATGTAVFLLTEKAKWPAASRVVARRDTTVEQRRQLLFDEIQPVKLSNCQLERFGEPYDGGYLVCASLLQDVKAGYSYGISGYDGWGCEVSRRLSVPVHQYDCFNLTRPACPNGKTIFHEECVAGIRRKDEHGRLFDTIANQLRKNGDSGNRIVLKIDVEGSEWESFYRAPEGLLKQIDQLVVEFHGIDEYRFLKAIWRLKAHFYVVHLHFNNHACGADAPFPAQVYEMLFVNKRIGVLDPGGKPELPHPLDRPNNPAWPDCQLSKQS